MKLQVVENMERETRIELATNSLEGCDSTIELLPHLFHFTREDRSSPRAKVDIRKCLRISNAGHRRV